MKEQERHAAIIIEYLILLLLVIGVSASMIGLQDNVKNYSKSIGNNLEQQQASTVSTNTASDSTLVTSGSLITEPEQPEPIATASLNRTTYAATGETLQLTVDNDGDYTYQWYSDNDPISGATSSTYTVQSSDNNSPISCSVSSDAGVVESLESCVGLDLNELSWGEIKVIAEDLSSSEQSQDSPYYQAVEYMMENGHTKTFETSSTDIGEKVMVSIIGICQDQKTDGGTAGLTFQTTRLFQVAKQMNSQATNAGGWETSELREWLNSTAYNDLPESLRENIVSVKKYSGNVYNNTSTDTVVTNDKLFLLSARELYNHENPKYPFENYEGTGENHDQQYAYYAHKNLTVDDMGGTITNNALYYINQTIDGDNPKDKNLNAWWLRTTYSECEKEYRNILGAGEWFSSDANNYCGVAPAFCL